MISKRECSTSKTWANSGWDIVFGIPATIRSGHLPNTSQKHYRLSRCDNVYGNEILVFEIRPKKKRCAVGTRLSGINIGLNNDSYNNSFIIIPNRFDSAVRDLLNY